MRGRAGDDAHGVIVECRDVVAVEIFLEGEVLQPHQKGDVSAIAAAAQHSTKMRTSSMPMFTAAPRASRRASGFWSAEIATFSGCSVVLLGAGCPAAVRFHQV